MPSGQGQPGAAWAAACSPQFLLSLDCLWPPPNRDGAFLNVPAKGTPPSPYSASLVSVPQPPGSPLWYPGPGVCGVTILCLRASGSPSAHGQGPGLQILPDPTPPGVSIHGLPQSYGSLTCCLLSPRPLGPLHLRDGACLEDWQGIWEAGLQAAPPHGQSCWAPPWGGRSLEV